MEEQQRILCIMAHDGAMIIYKFVISGLLICLFDVASTLARINPIISLADSSNDERFQCD